jgi:hypothetical protein
MSIVPPDNREDQNIFHRTYSTTSQRVTSESSSSPVDFGTVLATGRHSMAGHALLACSETETRTLVPVGVDRVEITGGHRASVLKGGSK